MAILPACVFSSGKLDQMDEAGFAQLAKNVEDTSFISGFILKDKASPKAVEVVKTLTSQIIVSVEGGAVALPDSIGALLDQYADALAKAGIEPQEIELIKATVRLVDSSLGNVKVGIDGIGSERTKQIILAVLKGLERGLK